MKMFQQIETLKVFSFSALTRPISTLSGTGFAFSRKAAGGFALM
jgi:hypothetical protein